MVHPPQQPRICRTCGRPLNAWEDRVTGSVHWQHGYLPAGQVHEPDPVIGEPTVLVCDFCAGPDPRWRYRARTFEADTLLPGVTSISIEDWAACGSCHDLIEAGRWRRLAQRALDIHPELDVPDRKTMRQALMSLHLSFRMAREGPAELV